MTSELSDQIAELQIILMDQQQTMESLRHLTIEETFELSEAILEANMEDIKKELGDLLLHIVFYAKIATEQGAFTITHIIQSLCEKLIHRHPHIYGQAKAETTQAAQQNWETKKLQEGKDKPLEWLSAHTCANARVHRLVLGAHGKRRAATGTVFRLDR